MCMNPAYASGSHTQGGVVLAHYDRCKDAVHPSDYGSGPDELPEVPEGNTP
jgi:hypothetical protein